MNPGALAALLVLALASTACNQQSSTGASGQKDIQPSPGVKGPGKVQLERGSSK